MSMQSLIALIYTSVYSAFIPFIFSIIQYKKVGKQLLWFCVYIFMYTITEFINSRLSAMGIRASSIISPLFSIVEFALLATFLRLSMQELIKKSWLIGGIILFSVFTVVNGLLWETGNRPDSNSKAVESIILTGLVLLYFFKTLNELKIPNLLEDPVFILASGILIYFGGNLFLFAASSYISELEFAYGWAIIHATLTILRNIIYAIGLWKTHQPPNYSLS